MTSQLPASADKPTYVNRMFARIAPTYDLMNRLMTGGQDRRWRRTLHDYCGLLDVGTGTGDITYTALKWFPGVQVLGADFIYEMIAVGQTKSSSRRLPFTQIDNAVSNIFSGRFPEGSRQD